MSDASNLPSESDLVETYDIHVGSGYAICDRFETTAARQAMDRIKAAARREGQAEGMRQAAYVAGDIAPDGMGGNDWFPSEWSDYVAAWLEYRADQIERESDQ